MGDSTLEDVFEVLAVDYPEGGKIEVFVHPTASFSGQSWDRESRKGKYIQYNPGEIIPNISYLRQTEQNNNARSGNKEPTKNSDSEDSEFSRSFPAGGSSNSDDSEEKKSPPETKRFHVQPLGNNSFALVGNSVEIHAQHKRTSRQLEYSTEELCPKCESIDLKELYDGAEAEHHSFNVLSTSAETCKLCALMLDAAGEPETSVFDDAESIKLRGVRSKTGGLTHIQVKFPHFGGDLAKQIPDGAPVVLSVNLELVAEYQSFHSETYGILGQSIGRPDDVRQAQRWLSNCLSKHERCNRGAHQNNLQTMPLLPTRVLDVGSANDTHEPFLFESKGHRGKYVALSHRWGKANITRTTLSAIDQHRKEIPLDSLCKTFRDAINVTRNLGFRYLWIDSLCIIQDSPEDWESEAEQMTEVYTNSILTLSASVATSGDSGMFYPRKMSKDVKLSTLTVGGDRVGTYSVTNRILSSFKDDVERGTLAQRAWCLQERVLAPRVLHFGRDQLHWECLSGGWSEASTEPIMGPSDMSGPIQSQLRQILSTTEWPSLQETLKSLKVDDTSHLRQIYGRGPYGKWYQMLSTYSRRDITNEQDKLPALAGLAKVFKKFSGDSYMAGLWIDDIPAGLLWSGNDFYQPFDSPSRLRRPAKRCAPSWSWASFDGPIDYPLGKLGDIDIPRDWQSVLVCAPDPFGMVEKGFIELSGRLCRLGSMIGFAPSFLDSMKDMSQYFLQDQIPRALYDEPGLYNNDEVDCLLIAFQGCGSKTCNHNAGCYMRFAYGLLLHQSGEFGTFKRVGIAMTYQSDWIGVQRTRIVLS